MCSFTIVQFCYHPFEGIQEANKFASIFQFPFRGWKYINMGKKSMSTHFGESFKKNFDSILQKGDKGVKISVGGEGNDTITKIKNLD